jgi:hypothetical protein
MVANYINGVLPVKSHDNKYKIYILDQFLEATNDLPFRQADYLLSLSFVWHAWGESVFFLQIITSTGEIAQHSNEHYSTISSSTNHRHMIKRQAYWHDEPNGTIKEDLCQMISSP